MSLPYLERRYYTTVFKSEITTNKTSKAANNENENNLYVYICYINSITITRGLLTVFKQWEYYGVIKSAFQNQELSESLFLFASGELFLFSLYE